MSHFSTLHIGLDVQKESIAVTYAAKEHEAEMIYPGTIGGCVANFWRRQSPMTRKAATKSISSISASWLRLPSRCVKQVIATVSL
jgi:hypothetical protein